MAENKVDLRLLREVADLEGTPTNRASTSTLSPAPSASRYTSR